MILTPTSKFCTRCNLIKPASDFCRDKRVTSGLQTRCRECMYEVRFGARQSDQRSDPRPRPSTPRRTTAWTRLREWERRDDMFEVREIENISDEVAVDNAMEGMGAEGEA